MIRWLWFLLLPVLLGIGCSGPRRPAPVSPDLAALPRLDAFHDSVLVLTIPPQPAPPPEGAVFDDGVRADASVYRIAVSSTSEPGRGWLAAPLAWTSMSAADKPRGVGPWVVLVRMPPTSEAKSITVAGRQYAINWLPDASLLPMPNEEAPEPLLNPWPPVADERARGDAGLLDRTKSESASPLTRWRFKLLYDGLAPGASNANAPPFRDPVIEAIARQNEDRWRVALAWLWAADLELAWRVKSRLAAVVDFGGGVYAPGWPLDHGAMDLLLSNLLDARITPQRRSELARAWLLDQPAAVSWVIDDAGLLDEVQRTPVAALGFVNLTDIATRVWVESQAREESDFVPVLAMSSLKLLVPMVRCTDPGALTSPLTAHVGRHESVLRPHCNRIPVRPPGVTIGPLLADYTMNTWLRPGEDAAGLAPPPDWLTAALLHRTAPDPAVPASAIESKRWELLVECRMAPGVIDPGALGKERVLLYMGPAGRPTAILQIDLSGAVSNLLPPDPLLPPELWPQASTVPITRAADRWAFRITLPPGSLEQDGTVRLGMIRFDARGGRAAWPRPMLPWQQEPGRAALRTSAWSELDAR